MHIIAMKDEILSKITEILGINYSASRTGYARPSAITIANKIFRRIVRGKILYVELKL